MKKVNCAEYEYWLYKMKVFYFPLDKVPIPAAIDSLFSRRTACHTWQAAMEGSILTIQNSHQNSESPGDILLSRCTRTCMKSVTMTIEIHRRLVSKVYYILNLASEMEKKKLTDSKVNPITWKLPQSHKTFFVIYQLRCKAKSKLLNTCPPYYFSFH